MYAGSIRRSEIFGRVVFPMYHLYLLWERFTLSQKQIFYFDRISSPAVLFRFFRCSGISEISFLGWYPVTTVEGDEVSAYGERLTPNLAYTYTVTEQAMELVAVYRPNGTAHKVRL